MTDYAELLERVKAATGPDREIDAAFVDLFGARTKNDLPFCAGILGIGGFTSDLNTIVRLIEQELPDTADRTHSCVVWTGARPGARILYSQREDSAEGGWAAGALNPWEVRGATPALALCAAFLAAKIAQATP